jgi:glutamine cyclotransferase
LAFISCHSNENKNEQGDNHGIFTPVSTINYEVTSIFSHDTTSFTEGLLIHNGKLYESTGCTAELPQTRSLFGEVDLKTGHINPRVEIDKTKYFGEGICFLNGKVYQLTYQTKVGFIYDAKSFKKISEFSFPSQEGWGMTTDSINLIMSDGTNVLTYLDPNNLKVIKKLTVTSNEAVLNINELEYIHGYIYANIYTTNDIIKIDPANGKVIGKLDLSSIESDQKNKYQRSLEMNGIAFNPSNNKVYITGKMWPNIYEIQFLY